MTEQERLDGYKAALNAASEKFGVLVGAQLRVSDVTRDGVTGIEATAILQTFFVDGWQPPANEEPAAPSKGSS